MSKLANPTADALHLAGQHAMVPMREAITELRAQGHDELASELTWIREHWASTVRKAVDALANGTAPAKVATCELRFVLPASEPVVPVAQVIPLGPTLGKPPRSRTRARGDGGR